MKTSNGRRGTGEGREAGGGGEGGEWHIRGVRATLERIGEHVHRTSRRKRIYTTRRETTGRTRIETKI